MNPNAALLGPGWDALTNRERRVVDLVGKGLTYREIGQCLCISRRTVETHVAHAFDKLGVRSRAELAAVLIERAGDAAAPRATADHRIRSSTDVFRPRAAEDELA